MIEIKFAGSTQDVLSDIRELLNAVSATPAKSTTRAKTKHATEAPAPAPTTPVTAPQPAAATPIATAPTTPAVPVTASTPTAAPAAQPIAAVPTAPAKAYTIAELQAASAPLIDAGRIADLQALMQSFGVISMTDIPEDRYGELATKLRELGAQI